MYRNPRFRYLHQLALIGDSGVHGDTSPAFTAPRTRMWDYRAGLQASQPEVAPAARGVFRIDQPNNPAQDRTKLTSIIIPPGHNVVFDRTFHFELDTVTPTVVGRSSSDAIDAFAVSSGKFPFVIDLEDIAANWYAQQFNYEYASSSSGLPFNLGELWWTNVVQTSTGVASNWPDNMLPTMKRTPMYDGSTYNRIDGPPRRNFGLLHHNITGADLRLYDELMRHVGYGAAPFWYEHPDSGDANVSLDALSTTANVTTNGNCSAFVHPGPAPDADDVVGLSAGGAGGAEAHIRTGGAEGVDARNSVLQIDVRLFNPTTWLAAGGDLYLRCYSPEIDGYSVYYIGSALVDEPRANEWIRCQIDLDTPMAGGGGGWDHQRLYRADIVYQADNSGDGLLLSGLRLIDKTKLPVLVEVPLNGYRKTQSNDVPSNATGPVFDVTLSMVEVTT